MTFLVAHVLRQLGRSRCGGGSFAVSTGVFLVLFGAGALGIVSELALLENALPNVTGNLTALCRLVGEQILVVVFVEHILDVELLAVGQLGANLTRVDNLLVDVELGALVNCVCARFWSRSACSVSLSDHRGLNSTLIFGTSSTSPVRTPAWKMTDSR